MHNTTNKWAIYESLIAGIPAGLMAQDCQVGLRWTMVRSTGAGMALTPPEGERSSPLSGAFTGRPLRELAALSMSWNPLEAAIGVAALNSYYNAPAVMAGTWDCAMDSQPSRSAFEHYMERIKGKKVAVIGHFPGLEGLATACELSILERRPQGADFPDPAAEYILPGQDAVFITGMTLINKTLPRLLELAAGAFTVLVGPSTPLSPRLFSFGVSALAGSVVADEARVWRHVAEAGERGIFKQGVHMVKLDPGMLRV